MRNSTAKQIWTVFTPSWVSALITVTATLVVVIGTIVISSYNGSNLQQELFEARAGTSTASALGVQTITDNLSRNSLISNLPLFLFWAVLGVIVYFFATSLWTAINQAEQLREEMNYVNASKQNLVHTAALHVLLRLLFLGLWLAYLEVFLKILLPYALDAAHVAADSWSVSNIASGLLAAIVLFVALQVHVTFLRLVFLRERMFGSAIG